MGRPHLEVADVFREYGQTYRQAYGSCISLEQRRVMRAIEVCRTEALGGHVDRCDQCGHQVISYNSCRNRHCPKCQNIEKALWREARRCEVLPVEYYHVVFTLRCDTTLVLVPPPNAGEPLILHFLPAHPPCRRTLSIPLNRHNVKILALSRAIQSP